MNNHAPVIQPVSGRLKNARVEGKMECCLISTVLIADSGRLEVYPKNRTFELVNKIGLDIHWDAKFKCLYSPHPKDRDYVAWFKQVIAAVDIEYGCTLLTDDNTNWTNLSLDMINEIKISLPRLFTKNQAESKNGMESDKS